MPWCRSAEALLELLRSTASSTPTRTGFVHVDTIADPYRTALISRSRLTQDPYVDRRAGLLLGGGADDRPPRSSPAACGGSSRTSPCHRVEVVEGSEGPVVLCTLTESPLDMDEAGVAGVEGRTSRPMLRDAYPVGWETLTGHGGLRIGTTSCGRWPCELASARPAPTSRYADAPRRAP